MMPSQVSERVVGAKLGIIRHMIEGIATLPLATYDTVSTSDVEF